MVLDTQQVSCCKGLVMHLSKYTMTPEDVDDLEMTAVNSTWLVTKFKFQFPSIIQINL